MSNSRKKAPARRFNFCVMLFCFLAFLLLAIRDRSIQGYILAGSIPVVLFLESFILPRLFPVDRLLLSLVNFLTVLGFLLLHLTNAASAFPQMAAYGMGLVCMICCIFLVRSAASWQRILYLLIPLSFGFMILPFIFGSEMNGNRSWVSLGSFSFRPSEIMNLTYIAALAWFLSRRKYLPLCLFSAGVFLLLLFQKDLSSVFLCFSVALLVYLAYSGHVLVLLLGIAGGFGAAFAGYQLNPSIRLRVDEWINLWKGHSLEMHSAKWLSVMTEGGLFGSGLGQGTPESISACQADFPYAILCNQLGQLFGFFVLLMYIIIIWRGTSVAQRARRCFHGLLSMGATILLGLQAFLHIAGTLTLIPMTGAGLPFISAGGSSLVSCMCLVGLIMGVASLNEDDLNEDTHLAMLGS